jgi:MFS family permease
MAVVPDPAPVDDAPLPARPGLRDALVAFRYRNFSLFWTGALLSSSGTWIQNVTLQKVVFEITGSKALLGITGALQFVPYLLMGPIGGWVADRFERRTVLLVTQTVLAALALVLWLAWVTDHHSIALIMGLVFVSGFVTGVNIPSWQAFVSELVPREVLLNAVTLNSTQFNGARMFGPAIGGLVLAFFGVSWAFLLNGLSYVAVIVALVLISVPKLPKTSSKLSAVYGQFLDALRYSRRRSGIVACFIVVVALGGLGSPMTQLFVVFAQDVFRVDDFWYGVLVASVGAGSLIAAPLIAGRGSGVRRSTLVEWAMLAYGLAVVGFGLSPTYVVALVALLVSGAGYLAIAATLNTTIQLQVDETMRGRVIATYIMLLTAALPLGMVLQGFVAQVFGPQAAVALFGVLFLVVWAYLKFGTDLLRHLDDERSALDGPEPVVPAVGQPRSSAASA